MATDTNDLVRDRPVRGRHTEKWKGAKKGCWGIIGEGEVDWNSVARFML